MVSDGPGWFTRISNFDPSLEWIPIVCKGRQGERHPAEWIGVYFDSPQGWMWASRADLDPKDPEGVRVLPAYLGIGMRLEWGTDPYEFRFASADGVTAMHVTPENVPEGWTVPDNPDGLPYLRRISRGEHFGEYGHSLPVVITCPACRGDRRPRREDFEAFLQASRDAREANVSLIP